MNMACGSRLRPRDSTLVRRFCAIGATQAAIGGKPLARIARQHLAPDVGVVAGRIAAGEHVGKIGRVVARRHQCRIDAVAVRARRASKRAGSAACARLRGPSSCQAWSMSAAARYSVVA